MKQFFVGGLLLIFTTASFCQQADAVKPFTHEDYLQKSRNQKTGAWILLGIGGVCFAVAAPGNVSFETLGTLVVVGSLSTLGSIPLFIVAGRNKRKAQKISAFINIENTPSLQRAMITSQYYPAILLRIRL